MEFFLKNVHCSCLRERWLLQYVDAKVLRWILKWIDWHYLITQHGDMEQGMRTFKKNLGYFFENFQKFVKFKCLVSNNIFRFFK
jgi:hypothetical protein